MGTGRDAGQDRAQRPAQATAGVLGGAVPWGGTLARPGFLPAALWPGAWLGRLRDHLRADARAEVASGRLILWLPVLFGVGILLYFGAAQEPSLIAACAVTLAIAAIAVLARAQPVSFAVLLAALALAMGFALARAHTAWVDHPILFPPPGPVRLTGYIEQVERRPKADRVLLRVTTAEGRGLALTPSLVRLSLGRGFAPPAGTQVSILARLLPPMEPAMPGGHDFGRGPWFQGIEAVGFALGRPKLVATPEAPPLSVRIGMVIEQVRLGIGGRIRQSLNGYQADIAVALVVGDRTAISPAIEESMRVSGLTHVLSISGLHMAMVAGTLFALVRGLLAAVPGLALSFPIKTTAALVALAGSAGYLVLSGNDWPAQRSFYMLAIVLVGVMVGRAALNLRTVAVAATVVLALGPQAILEAGTQMSFAATLALVAVFQSVKGIWSRSPNGPVAWQMLVKGTLFLAALSLTSLVAGAATAPYAALHFQRLGTYGLLSNLAAMPAVEFLVMPFGLAGVLLMPFGWDFLVWPVMGWGIEIMVRVSDFVAALPGADARTDMVGPAAAGAATLALLCLCLLRGTLTLAAVPPAIAAVLLLGAPQRPDVLVAPNAQTVAVRGSDGRLSVIGAKTNRLVVEQWLSHEGDTRKADARDLDAAFRCDPTGCVARLPDGARLAVAHRVESLELDCLEASILITPFAPPAACAAHVLTPTHLSRTGTLTLFRRDGRDGASEHRIDHAASPGALVRQDRAVEGGVRSRSAAASSPPTSPGGPGPAPATAFRGPQPSSAPSAAPERDVPDAARSTDATSDASDRIDGLRRMRPRRMAADHHAALKRQALADRAERARRKAASSAIADQPPTVRVTGQNPDLSDPTESVSGLDAVSPPRAIAPAATTPTSSAHASKAISQESSPEESPAEASTPQGARAQAAIAQTVPMAAKETFAARWRVVPTRAPGVQRPWMPVLPVSPEPVTNPDIATERAAEDATAEP